MTNNVTPIRGGREGDYDRELIAPFVQAIRARELVEQITSEEAARLEVDDDDNTEQTNKLLGDAFLARVHMHDEKRLLNTYLAATGLLEYTRDRIDRVIGAHTERDQ